MGQLKIVPGGMQLSGQALFLDVLRASSIRSKHGLPITIGIIASPKKISQLSNYNDCVTHFSQNLQRIFR